MKFRVGDRIRVILFDWRGTVVGVDGARVRVREDHRDPHDLSWFDATALGLPYGDYI